MNDIHRQIDRFGSLTPRVKTIIVSAVVLLVAGAFVLTFWAGTKKGREWADTEYLREREKRLAAAAEHERQALVYEQNQTRLAAENSLLRKQNEAQAEILRANDARIAGDAAKFDSLTKERNEKFKEIDLDSDFDSQLCGLCADGERAGFKFSAALCGRCEKRP